MRWLNDRYRIDAPVGRGGMAVVWRGYDAVLHRVVAIKTLPDRPHNDHIHNHLRTEALAAARLSHPNIANVYDYGQAPTGRHHHTPFIVMEYIDGHTLATHLTTGPLPWPHATTICAHIADALTHAHTQGLVHRDIKPGNIILSGPDVKVVDFGIATPSGGRQSPDGRIILGTQAYMAPEQLTGATALPASDIYALGVVLRECLRGERADAPADRTVEPAPAGRSGPAEKPLPPDIPAAVSAIVDACLAETPRLRPTAADVAATLHRALDARHPATAGIRAGAPASDEPTVPAGVTEPAGVTSRRPPVARHRSRRSSRRRRASQAALAASAAVLAVPLALQLPGVADGDGTSDDAGPSATPAPHGPPRRAAGDCVANFSARYLPNGTFTGTLDLTWTGTRSLSPWSVRFALPDGQRLVGADPGRLAQDDGTVSITSRKRLDPGGTVSVTLQGVSADRVEAPNRFLLDGRACTRSTSDVETTSTVPGPTRTVRVTPGTGATGDTQSPRTPPRSSRPPAGSPTPEPSSPAPSSPEPSSPEPSSPEPSSPEPSSPEPSSPAPSSPEPEASPTATGGQPPSAAPASPDREEGAGVTPSVPPAQVPAPTDRSTSP